MAFTMHSHSGQFCPGHAKDELEDIVGRAIAVGFKTMGLTEHMPREELCDLYPDELEPDPHTALAFLPLRHSAFLEEARRLQAKYADRIHILIGFEGEWIRPGCGPMMRRLLEPACVDYFVGSIHHSGSAATTTALTLTPHPSPPDSDTHDRHEPAPTSPPHPPPAAIVSASIPIDYDKAHYATAVAAHGGSEARLYATYLDAQLDMLREMRPRVVGHFDLIRLMSRDPGRDLRTWAVARATRMGRQQQQQQGGEIEDPALNDCKQEEEKEKEKEAGAGVEGDEEAAEAEADVAKVWPKVLRNLAFVASYGGWLECNTSALRKGLAEPYPARPIAEEWLRMGGRFTMSDDAHGVAHVATNYERALDYLESLGVKEVWTLERQPHLEPSGARAKLVERSVSLVEFRKSLNWDLLRH